MTVFQKQVPQVDVAIVGGGPASLLLALSIANRSPKTRVRILEQAPKGWHSQQGVLVHPYTQLLIERACDQVIDWSGQIDRFEEQDGNRLVTELDAVYKHNAYNRVYRPSNYSLGKLSDILLAKLSSLSNCEIINSCMVNDLERTRHGWRLIYSEAEDPYMLDCSLTVISDGRRSSLRNKLGILVSTHDFPGLVTLHAFDLKRDRIPAITLVREDQACTTIVDNGMGRNSLVFDMRLHAALPKSEETELMRFRAGLGGLSLSSDQKPIFSINLSSQVVDCEHWFENGVLLFGDAAHAMHNLGGQGFNTAAQNAVAFAGPIVRFVLDGSDSTIKEFESFRKPYVCYLQRWQRDFFEKIRQSSVSRIMWLTQKGGSLALGQDRLSEFTSVDQQELFLV